MYLVFVSCLDITIYNAYSVEIKICITCRPSWI